eukprot:9987238-Heterocapsa_arctica.AAC.1
MAKKPKVRPQRKRRQTVTSGGSLSHRRVTPAGATSSYSARKSGSTSVEGTRPTPTAIEWIKDQRRTATFHDFGEGHQPSYWPDGYYSQGYLICPPKVEQQDRWRFKDMEGANFFFQGLAFTYLGRNPRAAAKAHWE